MEYSVRRGFYFLLKFRIKSRARMALPVFLSPGVQDVAVWLYYHPSGHRNVALGTTSRGDHPPLQTAPSCLVAAVSGRRVGHSSFGLSTSWSPNWKYLGCQEQQRLTCFFRISGEPGVVGSAS